MVRPMTVRSRPRLSQKNATNATAKSEKSDSRATTNFGSTEIRDSPLKRKLPRSADTP